MGHETLVYRMHLDANLLSMNPSTDTDVNADSDEDSYDCNGNGGIDDEERFTNLQYESRSHGKKSQINNIDAGVTLRTFGQDAIDAMMQEGGMTEEAVQSLYAAFISKDIKFLNVFRESILLMQITSI